MIEFQPESPRFNADIEQLRCIVPVTNTSLALVLAWEPASDETAEAAKTSCSPTSDLFGGSTRATSTWTFLRLHDTAKPSPRSYPTAREALEAVRDSIMPSTSQLPSHDLDAQAGPRKSPPIAITTTTSNKPRTRHEMAEGEGSTPGAYGAAEDFWAGYSDDDEGGASSQDQDLGRHNFTHDDQVDDDTSYWNSYDEAEPQIEDEPERDESDHPLADRLSLDNDIESLDLDMGDSIATRTAIPGTGAGQARTATRSRRSSTVTPASNRYPAPGTTSQLPGGLWNPATAATARSEAAKHLPERFRSGTDQMTLSTLPSPDPSPLPTPPSISPGSAAMLTNTLKASLSATGAGFGNGPALTQFQAGLVGDGEDDMSLGSLGQSRDHSQSQSRGDSTGSRSVMDSDLKTLLQGAWGMHKRQSGLSEADARARFQQLAMEVTRG